MFADGSIVVPSVIAPETIIHRRRWRSCFFDPVPTAHPSHTVRPGVSLEPGTTPQTLGHLLRDRPGTVGAIAATFVSFYAFTPAIVAALGALGLWLDGKRTPGDGKAGSAGTVRRLDTPRNASDMGT